MKLLLDTNVLLWSLEHSPRLTDRALQALSDSAAEKVISIATFWEITIKVSLGKLVLRDQPDQLLECFERDRLATILPIRSEHLRFLKVLPFHHKDPFDRLIVSQALAEGVTLVSSDEALDAYGVTRLW